MQNDVVGVLKAAIIIIQLKRGMLAERQCRRAADPETKKDVVMIAMSS